MRKNDNLLTEGLSDLWKKRSFIMISQRDLPHLKKALAYAIGQANPGIGPDGNRNKCNWMYVSEDDVWKYIKNQKLPDATIRRIYRIALFWLSKDNNHYIYSFNDCICRLRLLNKDLKLFLWPRILIK